MLAWAVLQKGRSGVGRKGRRPQAFILHGKGQSSTSSIRSRAGAATLRQAASECVRSAVLSAPDLSACFCFFASGSLSHQRQAPELPSGCDGSVAESQRGGVRRGLETSLTSNHDPTMNSPAECSEALSPPRGGNRARELLREASVSIWERADLGALSFKSGQDQNWRRLARAESPEGDQCGCRLPARQQAFHCESRRRPSLRTAHG